MTNMTEFVFLKNKLVNLLFISSRLCCWNLEHYDPNNFDCVPVRNVQNWRFKMSYNRWKSLAEFGPKFSIGEFPISMENHTRSGWKILPHNFTNILTVCPAKAKVWTALVRFFMNKEYFLSVSFLRPQPDNFLKLWSNSKIQEV